MVERYYNEDHSAIAVLVSSHLEWSYGVTNLAIDKRVVEFYLEQKHHSLERSEFDEFVDTIEYAPKDVPCRMESFRSCDIEWVPVGTYFIVCYDGEYDCEYIIKCDPERWFKA